MQTKLVSDQSSCSSSSSSSSSSNVIVVVSSCVVSKWKDGRGCENSEEIHRNDGGMLTRDL